jgi:hypothetical protein
LNIERLAVARPSFCIEGKSYRSCPSDRLFNERADIKPKKYLVALVHEWPNASVSAT